MDYSGLKQAIVSKTARPHLLAETSNFISLAESQLRRLIDNNEIISKDLSFTSGNSIASLPDDYKKMFSDPYYIDGSNKKRLDMTSHDEMLRKYPTTETGKPCFFNVQGLKIKIAPTPDTNYTIKLDYYSKIPSLSDQNTTNFLLTNYPDIYYFASLAKAYLYTDDTKNRLICEDQLRNAILEYNNAELSRVVSAGTTIQSDYTV